MSRQMLSAIARVCVGFCWLFSIPQLLLNCHLYTASLNSDTSGDSKNALLHCGDVLGLCVVRDPPVLGRALSLGALGGRLMFNQL